MAAAARWPGRVALGGRAQGSVVMPRAAGVDGASRTHFCGSCAQTSRAAAPQGIHRDMDLGCGALARSALWLDQPLRSERLRACRLGEVAFNKLVSGSKPWGTPARCPSRMFGCQATTLGRRASCSGTAFAELIRRVHSALRAMATAAREPWHMGEVAHACLMARSMLVGATTTLPARRPSSCSGACRRPPRSTSWPQRVSGRIAFGPPEAGRGLCV